MFQKTTVLSVVLSVLLVLSSCTSHYRKMPRTTLDIEQFETPGTARLVGPAEGTASSYFVFGIPLNAPNKNATVTTVGGNRTGSEGVSTVTPLAIVLAPILAPLLLLSSSPSSSPRGPLVGGAYYDAMESVENADVLAFPRLYRVRSNYVIFSHTEVKVEGKAIRFVPGSETRGLSETSQSNPEDSSAGEKILDTTRSVKTDKDTETETEENWSEYLDRGQAAFEEENYSRAEDLFVKAIDRNPRSGFLKAWLAAAQYRQGKRQSARKTAQEALELNPDLKSAQRIIEFTQ